MCMCVCVTEQVLTYVHLFQIQEEYKFCFLLLRPPPNDDGFVIFRQRIVR